MKEQALSAFARSLLIHFGTPMWVAAFWNPTDIRRIEASHYRYIMGIPRNISTGIMMNTTQAREPVNTTIYKLARKLT
jgi:hypothetical protein